MCRAPASRKKQSVEDDKQTARVHGERIHCDLVGPTCPSINDEVYAMITHDDATGYPAARAMRTNDDSDDMYGNQSVSSVRTDNGGEFRGQSSKNGKLDMSAHCHVDRRRTPVLSVSTGQLQKAWLAYLLRLGCFMLSGRSVSWPSSLCMRAALVQVVSSHLTSSASTAPTI